MMPFRLKSQAKVAVMILTATIITIPFQNCGREVFEVNQASLFPDVGNNTNGVGSSDTVAPIVTLLSPTAGAYLKNPITVAGSCEIGSTVSLTINGSALQNLQCLGGSFSSSITLPQADGEQTLRASQTDAAGNLGSRQVSFFKDTTAPAPQFNSPAANARLTTQSLSISGSCESGLNVSIAGAALTAPAQVSCNNSAFTANVTLVSTNGAAALTLQQTDAAGNVGTGTRSIVIDLPVGAPVVQISNPAANLVTRTGITLSGVCVTGLPVNISGAGVSAASTTTCSGGAFSAAITFSSGDGMKTVVVAQTNSQGTTGQDSRAFVLDTTAPAIAIQSPAAGTSEIASVNLGGSCETGLTVAISGTGAASSTTTPCNAGMFMATVVFSNGLGLKTISATQTDAVGNSATSSRNFQRIAAVLDGKVLYANNCASCHMALASTTKSDRTAQQISGAITSIAQMNSLALTSAEIDAIAVALKSVTPPDTTAPVITILTPVANAFARTSVMVAGTCETGLPATVRIDNVVVQTLQCVNASFSGSVNLTQADGNRVLQIAQTDAAGNTGTRQVTFQKDSTAPAPQFNSPAANAQLTSQSQTVSGSCETGLAVTIGGTALSAPASVNCANSTFSSAVSVVSTNGAATLTLQQTDAAGNVGNATRSVTVAIPVVPPAILITSPAANFLTRTGITLAGTCVAGLPVAISGTGVNASSTTTCASGTFSTAITFSAGDGVKNVIVAQTNAQNVTGQNSRSFNFDATAPAIQITSPAAGFSATTSITLGGSCESGLNIVIGGAGIASQMNLVCSASMFQTNVVFSANIGVKTITVTQTDAAGNVGSSTRTFERTAPPVLDGRTLYANNCAACHGALATSTKQNRTVAQISGAITSISQMAGLASLTTAERDAIATALYVAPTQPAFACDATQPLDQKVVVKNMKRLTRRQYVNTLNDLLSRAFSTSASQTLVNAALGASSLPADDDSVFSRFDSAVIRQHMKAYFDIGDKLAGDLTGAANYSTFVSSFINLNRGTCTSINASALSTECATRFIANFGMRVLRRPLIANSEVNEPTLYMTTYTGAGGNAAGINAVVFKMLMAPQFLYQVENDGVTVSGQLHRLSSYGVASRLSYMFWNSMPDETLFQQAGAANLADDTAFTTALNYVADSSRAQDSIREFTSEWLKLNRIPQFATNNPTLNYLANGLALNASLRTAMIDEVQELASYVYRNNQTLNDLFLSDVSFARDSRLMSIYGVTTAAPADVTPANAVRFPAGQRSGILTRGAMLLGGSELANPIKRGLHVRRDILCLTLDNPPAELEDALEPPAPNVNMTTRQRYDNATSQPVCMNCHQHINSLGHGFSAYNSFGKYGLTEPTFDATGTYSGRMLPVDTQVDLGISLGAGLAANGATQLSTLIASHRNTRLCVSEKALRFAEGRLADRDKEGCRLNKLHDHLVQSRSLKDFMKSLAQDTEFRHRLIGN